MSIQAAFNVPRTPTDQALLAAWRRFLDYDAASAKQKVHHTRIRTAIIVLSLAASALAVISTYRDNPIIEFLQTPLYLSLVILPAISSVLLAYAASFAPSLSWLAYRTGAELVRREIYLYRMEAGDYSAKSNDEQQELLLARVEEANRRVNKIGAPDPYLQATIKNLVETIKKTIYDPNDDGFSCLDIDMYIATRVVPQKDWYIKKSLKDYDELRRWRLAVIIVTGLSSILAALGLLPLVAITTAIVTALATYMDLHMFGRNFPIYHPVANSLEIELDKYMILSREAQREKANISKFVSTVEDLFQRERDQWSQQAIQLQQAIEQQISKSAAPREGGSQATNVTTSNLTVSAPDSQTPLLTLSTTTVTPATDEAGENLLPPSGPVVKVLAAGTDEVAAAVLPDESVVAVAASSEAPALPESVAGPVAVTVELPPTAAPEAPAPVAEGAAVSQNGGANSSADNNAAG